MPTANLKELYREYLGKYTVMSVATADEAGKVSAASVCYGFDPEGNVCFAADKSTSKAKHLLKNPSVAVTMNDGGKTMMGIQIRGTAQAAETPDKIAGLRKILVERHPAVAQFYDNPGLIYWKVKSSETYLINFSWGVEWRQKV